MKKIILILLLAIYAQAFGYQQCKIKVINSEWIDLEAEGRYTYTLHKYNFLLKKYKDTVRVIYDDGANSSRGQCEIDKKAFQMLKDWQTR